MTTNNTFKIRKLNKSIDVDELRTKSQEELIEKIQALQAHNDQLKNILARDNKQTKAQKSKAKSKKSQKPFDFDKACVRHVLLTFYYLGWDYKGYTVQEDTTNTIEYQLFNAFLRTCLIKNRESSNYHRCGRTDKGVSSFSQTVSINLRSQLTNDEIAAHKVDNEIDYCKILNKVLPKDIQCIAWAPVDMSYSARFDCDSRTYKYFFPKGHLNIEKMRIASKYLLGIHDFRNLCKMDVGNGVTNFFRNLIEVDIENISKNKTDEFSMYVLTLKGKAFLWHQIRCIMGILFLVGSEKETPEIIKELFDIEKNPRKPEYNLASEFPLNLYESNYELETPWVYNDANLSSVITKLKSIWTENSIKSVMTESMIHDLEKKIVLIRSFEDIEDSTQSLLQGVKSKNYIPLLKRNKCDSLEDKIMHYVKRQRIQEISPNAELEDAE